MQKRKFNSKNRKFCRILMNDEYLSKGKSAANDYFFKVRFSAITITKAKYH